jgi:predicted Mrr-cat superfamily restriction endonuclease
MNFNEIDNLSGLDFEKFIARLFKKMGYFVLQTKGSSDLGCDVLLEKNGEKTAVQTKRKIDPVSNSAVQEVVASLKVYNAKHGMVVTNNNFQRSAIELASANNIKLINRNDLFRLIEKYDLGSKNDSEIITDNVNHIVRDCVNIAVEEYQKSQDKKKVYDKITETLVKNYGLLINSPSFNSHIKTTEFLLQSDHGFDLQFYDLQFDVVESKVDLGVLQGKARDEVSKMQLFMNILKDLEGDNKTPVPEENFKQELVKSEEFTYEESGNYIRRMLREASIYESTPGHFNRV